MYCDWDRTMAGKSWCDSSFIEFWDYPEYWFKNIRTELSLTTKEEIEAYEI